MWETKVKLITAKKILDVMKSECDSGLDWFEQDDEYSALIHFKKARGLLDTLIGKIERSVWEGDKFV